MIITTKSWSVNNNKNAMYYSLLQAWRQYWKIEVKSNCWLLLSAVSGLCHFLVVAWWDIVTTNITSDNSMKCCFFPRRWFQALFKFRNGAPFQAALTFAVAGRCKVLPAFSTHCRISNWRIPNRVAAFELCLKITVCLGHWIIWPDERLAGVGTSPDVCLPPWFAQT